MPETIVSNAFRIEVELFVEIEQKLLRDLNTLLPTLPLSTYLYVMINIAINSIFVSHVLAGNQKVI